MDPGGTQRSPEFLKKLGTFGKFFLKFVQSVLLLLTFSLGLFRDSWRTFGSPVSVINWRKVSKKTNSSPNWGQIFLEKGQNFKTVLFLFHFPYGYIEKHDFY
jgi:hypothetical protein